MPMIRTERSAATPEVLFMPRESRLRLQGECFPRHPAEFFAPILYTLQHHLESRRPPRFEAHLQLLYVSRAATASLRELLSLLDGAGREGTLVRVHWAHPPADAAARELGAELAHGLTHTLFERQTLATPGPAGASSHSVS